MFHCETLFLSPVWQPVFAAALLKTFDDFWNFPGEWVERCNYGRGGWSGVARCCISLADGGSTNLFFKRQQNYVTRTLRHPLAGIPTLQRELRNILHLQERGVGTPVPVFFAKQKAKRDLRCILVTQELKGFQQLSRSDDGEYNLAAARASGRLLRAIHAAGLNHGCYYPKHVFLRTTRDGMENRVIDLEKAKSRCLGCFNPFRDLETFLRRCEWWTEVHRLAFVSAYFEGRDVSVKRFARFTRQDKTKTNTPITFTESVGTPPRAACE